MTKPYPMELRLRAVRFVEAGASRHAVAKRLGVGVSTVIKWLQRFSKTGSLMPCKVGGHMKPKISGTYRDWVLAQVKAGDVTLHQLAGGLAERGLKVDAVTVWHFLRREGKRFKKNRSWH
jgi:putative transposase